MDDINDINDINGMNGMNDHNDHYDHYHNESNQDIVPSNTEFEFDFVLFCAASLLAISFCQSSFYICSQCHTNYKERCRVSKLTSTVTEETLDNLLNECVICLDGFKVDDKIYTLPCNHIFHKTCIQPWLSANPNCPLCRVDIL